MVLGDHWNLDNLLDHDYQVVPSDLVTLADLSLQDFQGCPDIRQALEAPVDPEAPCILGLHCPHHPQVPEDFDLDPPFPLDPLYPHQVHGIQALHGAQELDFYSPVQVYLEALDYLQVLWVLGGLWVL